MKEYPILFQTEMVQAICKEIKTQTRRLAGLQMINLNPDQWELALCAREVDTIDIGRSCAVFRNKNDDKMFTIKCPYGSPGDLLYVRESWANILPFSPSTDGIIYYAERSDLTLAIDLIMGGVKWKPSIHLKKEHSRLWLTVNEISVERLHDLTEESAMAEGVSLGGLLGFGKISEVSYREGFFNIWIDINGSESLKKNPWLWVVKFSINKERSRL